MDKLISFATCRATSVPSILNHILAMNLKPLSPQTHAVVLVLFPTLSMNIVICFSVDEQTTNAPSVLHHSFTLYRPQVLCSSLKTFTSILVPFLAQLIMHDRYMSFVVFFQSTSKLSAWHPSCIFPRSCTDYSSPITHPEAA